MSGKLIAVFGATGQQGSSVVRALVKDKQYCVRATTRNPDSDKGKALNDQGCEVVRGDFDDKESLIQATKGAYGVFLVTDYWATLNKETEIRQGKDAVDACKKNNVKHLVFSGLESCVQETGIEVPHFDSKAEVEEYIKAEKIPYTIVRIPGYIENLFSRSVRKQEDGTFVLKVPFGDVPSHLFSIFHLGEPVRSIFNNPQEYLGMTIGLSAGKYSIEEVAQLMSKHCAPAVVKHGKIPLEVYRSLPIPGADELANMFDYIQRGKFERDPVLTRKLDPNNPDLEQCIIENKDALRKQLGVS